MSLHNDKSYCLTPGALNLEVIAYLLKNKIDIVLGSATYHKIDVARKYIQRMIDEGITVYGINTGFGILARNSIPSDDLKTLQRNIVLSHAAGVGKPLDITTVKLIMLLKINSLAQGYSGITKKTLNHLILLYNHCIYPVIPSQGSVGASGDLAPLAHMSAPLIGEGEVYYESKRLSARKALSAKGLNPIELQEKEGLALLNGTQVSTAIAIMSLLKIQRNYSVATISGSLSIDAAQGSLKPFDSKIAELKRCEGQSRYTKVVRELLAGSTIMLDHKDCVRVQDPYSLRCQPQVMGSIWKVISDCSQQLINEANSVSDNPLIFAENDEIISGGNFHAERVAIASDMMSIVCAEIGALSERRISLLIDHHLSGLPPFLIKNPGLNSGFMLAHVTASSLASENKTFAHPASVDSLPTSANQEDHVSMATFAARKCDAIADNVLLILAIETLAACQGISLRRPLRTGRLLEEKFEFFRAQIHFYDQDRYFAKDIDNAKQCISTDLFFREVQSQCFQ